MATIDQLLDVARARLTRVTAAEAAQALADGAVLVDIRAESQIARSGSIPGAIVTPRNVLEWRADPASETHDLGIADATDLIDGFDGWIAAGLPIEPGQDSGVPM
jgi:rhodanese-related sulfurtransferase